MKLFNTFVGLTILSANSVTAHVWDKVDTLHVKVRDSALAVRDWDHWVDLTNIVCDDHPWMQCQKVIAPKPEGMVGDGIGEVDEIQIVLKHQTFNENTSSKLAKKNHDEYLDRVMKEFSTMEYVLAMKPESHDRFVLGIFTEKDEQKAYRAGLEKIRLQKKQDYESYLASKNDRERESQDRLALRLAEHQKLSEKRKAEDL